MKCWMTLTSGYNPYFSNAIFTWKAGRVTKQNTMYYRYTEAPWVAYYQPTYTPHNTSQSPKHNKSIVHTTA